uniref:Uncharacterized protein n=1 Tax=Odontella aurita TaxID=265563 RepID=A0A7S4K5A1_9STRA|mmetsp:Transcript_61916/g.182900  ORF Transcript_61916/g.182900 Transcript_61916/m.182900 type:complete len:144 (+) Transcript_61916:729-1160(+)
MYLNGRAGTWFPYARTDDAENAAADSEDVHDKDGSDDDDASMIIPVMVMEGEDMADNRVPGRDGLVVLVEDDPLPMIVGDDDPLPMIVGDDDDDERRGQEDRHVARIRRGDSDEPVMDWTSLHAGMPTEEEKWITLNWIRYDG